MQSFACDVDIEDLGLHAKRPGGCAKLSDLPPSALALPDSYSPSTPATAAGGVPRYSLGPAGELTLLVPGSLAALAALSVWRDEDAVAAGSVRLLAGNTGVGIYKDWPVRGTLVDLNQVGAGLMVVVVVVVGVRT